MILFKPYYARMDKKIERLRNKKDLPGLIKALSNKLPGIRVKATEALGEIGNKSAMEAILPGLNGDWELRKASAYALGKFGDQRAVKPLFDRLLDRDIIYKPAAESLMNLGSLSVEQLIIGLNDPNKNLRLASAELLGDIADERAIEPLITALQDTDKYVRNRTIEALGKLGEHLHAIKDASGENDNRVATIITSILTNVSPDDYRQAAEALVKLGLSDIPSDTPKAFQAWFAAFKGAWSRAVLLGSDAVEPLIDRLASGEAQIRIGAAKTLGYIGDKRAIGPLKEAIRSGYSSLNSKLGEAASEALAKLGIVLERKDVEELLRNVHRNW